MINLHNLSVTGSPFNNGRTTLPGIESSQVRAQYILERIHQWFIGLATNVIIAILRPEPLYYPLGLLWDGARPPRVVHSFAESILFMRPHRYQLVIRG